MVYTHGLGPCAARRGGSSPLSGTIQNFLQTFQVFISKRVGT